MGKRGMPRTRDLISFRFPFQVLAFLKSIKGGERTAFLEALIKASPAFQDWQKRVEA